MKTLAILLALFVGSLIYAQETQTTPEVKTGTITVVVPNVSSDQGEILFALYSEDNFLNQQPKFHAMSEIKDGKAVGIFENVPAGTYSVVFFHDKNGNKKMDFESNGMPMEDYGTSGTTSYGPPQWNDTKFEYDASSKEMEIRL